MNYDFDELLGECGRLHGHLCPGQILGVRMALLGCRLIGIDDPRGSDRRKLLVWVEIDRCMTDAVSAVTGARLGRRSLKFVDYGKVAATFLNIETEDAVRILALEGARELADVKYGDLPSKRDRQMRAYREAEDSELFKIERVKVLVPPEDLPGAKSSRVVCERCGEAINYGRVGGREGAVCRPCATGGYYSPIASDNAFSDQPSVKTHEV
jgi:formylmethanofuran dehydrogenase subunit E